MAELIFTNESGLVSKLPMPSVETDRLLERMQTPAARRAMESAFNATPAEMGKAAVKMARRERVLTTAYARLHDLIQSSITHDRPKTMLVTSSLPAEGKTITAVNAARELARGGARVLLIDAHMDSPQLHFMLGVKNTRGLSSILSNQVTPAQVHKMIKQVDYSNVCLLPSGRITTPTEMWTLRQMQELLGAVREHFNYIIIDSPPITAFKQDPSLPSLVDSVMLVKAQTTSALEVQNALRLLQNIGAIIIQVVPKWGK